MPSWLKQEDEPKWQKAKEAALKSHKESDDGFYAIVTEIFKRMGGKPSGSAAKSSDESNTTEDTIEAGTAEPKEEVNQYMKESNDIIQCRSTYGTQLPTPKPWVADQPVTFIYAPEGLHTITAGFRKADTITISVVVDEETAPALQEAFDHLTATMPKQEPYADEDHEGRKATLRFSPGQTKFSWGKVKDDTGVVISGGCPTSYGAESVNGKVYRSYSPEFASDADYTKATVDKETRHWTFPDGVRGSEGNPARLVGVNFVVGALTNRPAFRQMPPVRARQAEVEGDAIRAAGTHEGAEKGWETKHHYLGNDGQEHAVQFGPGEHVEERRAFKSAQKQIIDHGHNKYFDAIPVKEHSEILEKHGFSGTALDGIYTGAEGHADAQVGPRTMHHMSWYKMPSGRYEITAYMSHRKGAEGNWRHKGQEDTAQAADPTVSDTVKAAWSDAAREASAESRRSHAQSAIDYHAGKVSHHMDMNGYFTVANMPEMAAINHKSARAHVASMQAYVSGKKEDHEHARKMHEEAATANMQQGLTSKAANHLTHAEEHHNHVKESVQLRAKSKASDSTALDSIKSKSREVMASLAERRSATLAVLDGVMPKPPVRHPAKNGAEVLAELAFNRDHPKVKATWSDAARQASSEARKEGIGMHHGLEASANAMKLSKQAKGVRGHQEAMQAHYDAASFHTDPSIRKYHSNVCEFHRAEIVKLNAASTHATDSIPFDSIKSRASEKILKNNGEKVLGQSA